VWLSRERWLAAILVATAAVGTAYLVIMPAGLPYDEPSHWLNVRFLLEHRQLPQVGDPEVTYEAQMGPLAYVVMALVAAPWWPGSPDAAFYAARAIGLVELLALVVVVWRLTRKTFPAHPAAALLAAATLGLNPVVLAVSTSVQNDVLSLLLGALAIDVATSRSSFHLTRGLLVGVLLGLGLLAKVTVWPIGLVLVVVLLRRSVGMALACTAAAALVSGWWFVRNLVLYGDVTGRAAVEKAGYDFAPLGFEPTHLARETVTYLWIPVEYVRNALSAPSAVDALVIALTIVGLASIALGLRRVDDAGWILVAVAVTTVVSWVVTTVWVQGVAFRYAYPALLAWFPLLGGAVLHRRSWPLGALLVLGSAGLDVWALMELAPLSGPGVT